MKSLVVAEHNNSSLNDSTLHTISAALKINDSCDILVCGYQCDDVAKQASKIQGCSRVILVDDITYKNTLAENIAALVLELAQEYSHILTPSNTFGKNFMPRVAALLDVAQITDMIEVIDTETFKRPIYAGNAIATVSSSDKIKVITVRSTAFEKAVSSEQQCDIQSGNALKDCEISSFIGIETSDSEWPDLTSAKTVISGGRGMGSAENFQLLEKVAKKLNNCAIGASRAAVDAGYAPNDLQVGQTGKIVAPELYIAVGLSGAIQHLAGMKESKIIVAIKKDENAPIFEVADYGLVSDLFDILPELEQML